jgi:hypothetical protein
MQAKDGETPWLAIHTSHLVGEPSTESRMSEAIDLSFATRQTLRPLAMTQVDIVMQVKRTWRDGSATNPIGKPHVRSTKPEVIFVSERTA